MIGCMVDHAGKLSPMRIIKLLARMGGADWPISLH
jgi:hypothetical protein